MVKVLARNSGTFDWYWTKRPRLLSSPVQLPKIGSSDYYRSETAGTTIFKEAL